jgi:Myb/SANT-like DNA-binding domain
LLLPQATNEEDSKLQTTSGPIPVNGDISYGENTYDDLGRIITLGDIMPTEDKLANDMKKLSKVSGRKKKQAAKYVVASDGDKKEDTVCRWTENSFSALVDAKVVELNRLLDKGQTKFHMLRADLKWEEISKFVAALGFNYNATQCKHKWSSEHSFYKKVSDFQNYSGREDYFTMDPGERKKNGLPPNYSEEHYRLMDSALKDRANINPPGIRDPARARASKVSSEVRKSTSNSSSSVSLSRSKGDDKMELEEVASGADYNTKYLKKRNESTRKKRKVEEEKKGDLSIEAILEKVMKAAAEEQKKNVQLMVEGGHEDLKILASLMQQMIDKQL